MSGENLSKLGELPESDIPQNMKIWEQSVIHLEGAQNIEQVQNRIHQSSASGQNISSLWGAAVFIDHLGKNYLLTSRDIVHDSTLAHQIRRSIRNGNFEALSNEIRLSKDLQMEAEAQAAIYQILFKIPSIKELKGKNAQAGPVFLMGLDKGELSGRAYTFSNPDINLAIISLNRQEFRFAENLLASGYKPVPSDRIGQSPSASGVEIFTVGYPVLTALSRKLDVSMEEEKWTGALASVPTYSYGHVEKCRIDNPTFECKFGMDVANSGSPIIENNMLVGLLQKPIAGLKSEEVAWQSVKASQIWKLIKIQARKDSIYTTLKR